MKKIIVIISVVLGSLLPGQQVLAQSDEIQQLLLNIEKLAQFKQILKDMKKGYEVLNGGYKNIRDISSGNFKLHQAFLDGLLKVSPAVRNYKRVGDIISYQVMLVKTYQNAYTRFKQDKNLDAVELDYISRVYGRLLAASLRNLNELSDVMTAGKMRMSDDERLQAIDRIYLDMGNKLNFLSHFNSSTLALSQEREREGNEVRTMRKVYGIN